MRKKLFIIGLISLFIISTVFSYTALGLGLVIDAPDSVLEGTDFVVTVFTSDGDPIDGAKVSFVIMNYYYYTNSSGQVILTAPQVDANKKFAIVASIEGPIATIIQSTWILVINSDDSDLISDLEIEAPSSVLEGEEFNVTVTCDNEPAESALVTFNIMGVPSDSDGVANFVAPYVEMDTSFLITAIKQGCGSTDVQIMVLNQEEEVQFGWISGIVTDSSGNPLNEIDVCVMLPSGSLKNCTFSDDSGEFNFTIDPDSYVLNLYKKGYYEQTIYDVQVTANIVTVINVALEQIPEEPDSHEDIINEAIERGDIGAELSITQTEDGILINESKYANITIDTTIDDKKNEIRFKIDGDDEKGRTLIFYLDTLIIGGSLEKYVVEYDGITIPKADNLSDIINPNDDGSHIEYLLIAGSNTNELYVSVPHFSEHTITFRTIIDAISNITAIYFYILFTILIGMFLVSPAIISAVYHSFFKSKK
jgi:hypothetical protein